MLSPRASKTWCNSLIWGQLASAMIVNSRAFRSTTLSAVRAAVARQHFRTEVVVPQHSAGSLLEHSDPVLLVGSCFSEHIGERLNRARFDAVVNPFGISFHPLPLARSLELLASETMFTAADLEFEPAAENATAGLYYSLDHHTRFSHPDVDQCLVCINAHLAQGAAQLRRAKFLFVTLGTSWGYELAERPGYIVANCHRLPPSRFTKRMCGPVEAAQALRAALDACKRVNPALQVVLTVSPVRHWRDGAVENNRGKASLLLAVDKLVNGASAAHAPWVTYFPSYELVLDDLRDYRFFQPDMLHPSEVLN